ncbi:MAG: NADH-ubiquinone oxidoreductase-F iron-sulfur binding region domain-containing protein [Planctomycetota bacterium]
MEKLKSIADLETIRKKTLEKYADKTIITICSGTGCRAYGAQKVSDAFAQELEKQKLTNKVILRRSGCHGFCERGPIIVIFPEEICYLSVKTEDVAEIISETIMGGKKIERLMYKDEKTGEAIPLESHIPFYKYQKRLILANNTRLDPTSIEDYIGQGGYSALAKVLAGMSPEDVLEKIKKSNLRGRGGGGFPAGLKWETTRNAPEKIKYVVINADEGDPGAYMNRSVLEGNPHSVLEGLIITGYTIGAQSGFIYVRQEYPLALENTLKAIADAEKLGLLGNNILTSKFSFNVKVHRGAGAFVSGESSALMTALEGRVGEPRLKYIKTAVSGLWEKPTNLNNVETYANVPLIINNGVDWFTKIGTKNNYGTKIFSLVGKVKNTGLVEVPLGTTLRKIIYDIGGGLRDDKKFKAVQTGGPSGGCIPENMLDLPVDFDELTKAGSMMGSGGMIVMDEDSCMVDVARYFLQFLSEESCGKCIPCREGIAQMLDVLKRITEGQGVEGDVELLMDISQLLEASLCALGTTAANPVLTTMKYFLKEYDAHIKDKTCPAHVCKALTAYYINPEKCTGCMVCLKQCPVNAITGGKKMVHVINQKTCTKCGTCFEVCPKKSRSVEKISPQSKLPKTPAEPIPIKSNVK